MKEGRAHRMGHLLDAWLIPISRRKSFLPTQGSVSSMGFITVDGFGSAMGEGDSMATLPFA